MDENLTVFVNNNNIFNKLKSRSEFRGGDDTPTFRVDNRCSICTGDRLPVVCKSKRRRRGGAGGLVRLECNPQRALAWIHEQTQEVDAELMAARQRRDDTAREVETTGVFVKCD